MHPIIFYVSFYELIFEVMDTHENTVHITFMCWSIWRSSTIDSSFNFISSATEDGGIGYDKNAMWDFETKCNMERVRIYICEYITNLVWPPSHYIH